MLMFGVNRLAKGLRTANPLLALGGFVIALIGFLRSRDRGDRQLLYSKNLRPGQELRFRLSDADRDPAGS